MHVLFSWCFFGVFLRPHKKRTDPRHHPVPRLTAFPQLSPFGGEFLMPYRDVGHFFPPGRWCYRGNHRLFFVWDIFIKCTSSLLCMAKTVFGMEICLHALKCLGMSFPCFPAGCCLCRCSIFISLFGFCVTMPAMGDFLYRFNPLFSA